MSIEALKQLIPPPVAPLEVGEEASWQRTEHRLDTQLPNDYKSYIDTYGTGYFGPEDFSFLWPLNPFSATLSFFRFQRLLLEAYEECRLSTPHECPFATWPVAGGLLSWGRTDNGDTLCWLTENEPDRWTTIVYDSKFIEYERFSLSMTEFLVEWLRGSITPCMFPHFSCQVSFFSCS
ncbi:MAG: SMI1/KNR4 family protein [Armatimonadetes bacterium]|nr:SMI1/KNR4 family protein [Armatimonadota bacterium]